MSPVADKTSGVVRSDLSPSLSVHINASTYIISGHILERAYIYNWYEVRSEKNYFYTHTQCDSSGKQI